MPVPDPRARRRCRLLVALLLGLVARQPALPAPVGSLYLWPTTVRQGGTLFATFSPAPGTALEQVEFRWQNRSWPATGADGQYQCVLPVSYAVPAGPARLAVVGRQGGTPLRREVNLVVTATRFPVQRLTLSRRQEALYSYPGVEEEYRAIREALGRLTPQQSWQLPFLLPVPGRLRTSYGLTRIINRGEPGRHKGVDLAAPSGTPVSAAAAGTVALARPDFRLHGQTVVVDHGLGVATLYLHLSQVLVHPGQTVAAGDPVGLVGATGVSTGPHLHWALYVHGVAVDPLWWTHAQPPSR